MTLTATIPITLDDHGIARIEGTTIRVTDIVQAQRATGKTPEELQTLLPALSLAQIYAALAYYHAYRETLDAEEEHRRAEIERRLNELKQPDTPPPGQDWLALATGKWPGNETDAEIDAALEKLS